MVHRILVKTAPPRPGAKPQPSQSRNSHPAHYFVQKFFELLLEHNTTFIMPASDSAPATELTSGAPVPAPSPTVEPPKLTGAELKKQKQAEKAARRAQAVIGKAAIPQPPAPASSSTSARPETTRAPQRRANNSSSTSQQDIAIRTKKSGPSIEELKVEDKTVEFFRHLTKTKTVPAGLKSASKDVHPAVQVLGLQMSNYMICGSSARLVATLQAFKKVVAPWDMILWHC